MRRRTLLRFIEFSFFVIVCLIFVDSVFDLGMETSTFSDAKVNRSPQSIAPGHSKPSRLEKFETYTLDCKTQIEPLNTLAAKLRVAGSFCGDLNVKNNLTLKEARVENKSNQYHATVFKDPFTRLFSTDFIPLKAGENKLRLEFIYENGKTYPFELVVVRK